MGKKKKQSGESDTLFASGEGNGSGEHVALQDAARSRYLNYALSVITSRALPDVRDGLKPVQRRILYTMWQQGVTPGAKHRKCAKVVGDVMGNYHPHGDLAIYEALVRMAQPFTMRLPLIDGAGNFGSPDGDAAAAMRYTECRLAPPSEGLLAELGQETVAFRDNYDGTRQEPTVLPAHLPNLLINGSTGIAVGMATHIPPHHPGEVAQALLKLLENPERKTADLCRYVRGPDFPTGGRLLAGSAELKQIYREGTGTLRLRATHEAPRSTRAGQAVKVTSVPWNVNKAQLVERIAEVVASRKLPPLLDVKDLSTDEIHIELEIKKDADPEKVMAYLFRHTPLQVNIHVNLTCLVPTENPEVGRPERCDLRAILQHFLNFRLEVVTRRLEHELAQLRKRIHVLEGFAVAYDALDDILKIIRGADGKSDAAEKIMKKHPLDATQTDAILEMRLYRLARLEIKAVREELETKQARAEEVQALLDEESAEGRWGLVKQELEEVRKVYGGKDNPRATVIAEAEEEPELAAEDLIEDEDHVVILTRDGWVKRQKQVKDPSATRVREGDRVIACEAGSTRATIAFFSSFGMAYTCRIADIPATTGHGQPIQKLFRLADGERVVAGFSFDERVVGEIVGNENGEEAPETHGLAVASHGNALRFSLGNFAEPSARSGRRFARLGKGAEIVGVEQVAGDETVMVVTASARALLCPVEEINFLSGAGKGVTLIKLGAEDRVLGCRVAVEDRDTLTVKTSQGGQQRINTGKYEVASRGGKGRAVLKRGKFTEIVPEGPPAPVSLDGEEEE